MQFVYLLNEHNQYEDGHWTRAAFLTEEEAFDAYRNTEPSENFDYTSLNIVPIGFVTDDQEWYNAFYEFHKKLDIIAQEKYCSRGLVE